MDYKSALSQKKLEFIQQIISETSLDTLRAWMDMYDEARFVAAIDSDEEELKAERTEMDNYWKQKTEGRGNRSTIK